jgi:HEAT repeat protein
LLELLQDESPQRRKLAAWTLGSIRTAAGETIPALLVAVRDGDEGVRKVARAALEKIGPAGKQDRTA